MSDELVPLESRTKKAELTTSLFLTFIVIPALTVGGIAAYGFMVWFMQILSGPPGSQVKDSQETIMANIDHSRRAFFRRPAALVAQPAKEEAA